VDFISKTQ
jgi:hypothetical protein